MRLFTPLPEDAPWFMVETANVKFNNSNDYGRYHVIGKLGRSSLSSSHSRRPAPFCATLIGEARKEWEDELASAHKEEPEEKYLSSEEVCKIFGVCQATLWDWHRKGYLCHVKWGNKNMYPISAVNAIRYARSQNETVSGYCKRKSKVDNELLSSNQQCQKGGR